MQIISSNYQRNGVSGVGFVSALVYDDIGKPLLVTVAYGTDGETLDPASCRVVNPCNMTEGFRGDVIGEEFIKAYAA